MWSLYRTEGHFSDPSYHCVVRKTTLATLFVGLRKLQQVSRRGLSAVFGRLHIASYFPTILKLEPKVSSNITLFIALSSRRITRNHIQSVS